MDFLLNTPNTAVNRRFRHIQRLLYFNQRVRLHSKIENSQLVSGKITFPQKSFALRFCEFRFDIQRVITPSF